MLRPLAGIRILDLTNVLAGPFCCHQLVHFGAEVIKVEATGRGDLARQLGADPELNARNMGISFLAQNAGKKSVTVNLKDERGKAIFRRLVESADVLVENFRPGVMERLGVGYEALKDVNPQLIYCAISGFGQSGPWIGRPAYDQIIQGASGVMSITGDNDSGPLRVGYPIADTIGGLTAAFAIAAALNAEERGAFLDVSMLEATIATMGWVVSNYLIGGVEPSPKGNENMTSAPSGSFQAQDGLLNIAANKDEQWQLLAHHLGRGDLLQDPDFATREKRKENRVRLKAELETALTRRPARDWVRELNEIGVPAGAVMSVPDILAHPQIAERGMLGTFQNVPGVGRDITVIRTGIKMSGEAPSVDAPPPQLGEHNQEVYGALGLPASEIETLQKEGAI
ncbi:CaiB/BaiF CoA transferase family protein [Afifella marina]|uniref:Crotonobetainyl-CoA:carnitine CoA-transferase CaiB n=1 Tax=Afifella marina DSM 2698 TaxID=1120955 RepID=A0A1G5P154_AFIMA|nr:CoA transferase [Afifella marina]MBK1624292.1 CoA transferase [Afifella marina DSM 2698]MBK1628025.1 CoA transferase [Afifella marina]MBK5918219.1 CoA transferase [Afifella marina]RAI19259.1 CoA transferase [Afifella marina DSM 2698]SCZ43296.1 Crotonobetainyl-CoA:carnitine CoA-transferase CaiB [Afifella marina DSM 2698]